MRKADLQSTDMLLSRTATDSSGCVGSLYDVCQDQVLGNLNTSKQFIINEVRGVRKCEVIFGNQQIDQNNLLKMIDIDDNLRLSILLNVNEKKGIDAIADYSGIVSEHTRLLHYVFVHRTEALPDDREDAQKLMWSETPVTKATHIVSGIDWGIDVVIILQLPTNVELSRPIDSMLQQLKTYLYNENSDFKWDLNNENLIRNIHYIKIYSNIADINHLTSLHDVCQFIQQNRSTRMVFQPITYYLRPIKWLYPQYKGESVSCTLLPPTLIEKVEEYLLYINIFMVKMMKSLNEDIPKLIHGYLRVQIDDLREQVLGMRHNYTSVVRRLAKLLIDVRSGHNLMILLEKELKSDELIKLKEQCNHLIGYVRELQEKASYIDHLEQLHFKYVNVCDYDIDHTDTEQTIEQKLVQNINTDRIICSTNALEIKNTEQFGNLRRKLMQECMKNPNLRLIYGDFSYSSYKLLNIVDIPSNLQDYTNSKLKYNTIEEVTELQDDNSVSILLLGASGVGKSTFINAFANYLRFNTLDDAQAGKPLVLMPVSFIIATGDNFDEHIIHFNDTNDPDNEDFNHPGQSVTQHCKSYEFEIDQTNGIKLRIIDTPGFGDTRGIEQDDRNMKEICDYIKTHLSHIHGVCVLLKPNESRLNIYFRTCLTQLFSIFGTKISNNLIFCFTNSRSTFYAPGNTAPLLKKMLASLSMGDKLFRRENTFCFDSEAFRFLVARQNNIEFEEDEKEEYEKSWIASRKEANRLIDYVCNHLSLLLL